MTSQRPGGSPTELLDRSSPLPVYFQVAIDLRRRIAEREWLPGEQIAAETVFAQEYDVSRMTVRQALAELAKDDLLERRRGAGTFLREAQRPLVYDLGLTVGALANRWRDERFDNRAEVIEAEVLRTPPSDIRHRLELGDTEDVLYLLRRVLINGTPTVLYRSWFDAALVPGLERSKLLEGSLSHALVDLYALAPVRAETELEVVRATRDETRQLRASSDVPIAVVTSTTYLESGRPLEHARLAWLGDRVRFRASSFAAAGDRPA